MYKYTSELRADELGISTMATMKSALVSNYENEHILYIECFH
jgi:hypothetical protein